MSIRRARRGRTPCGEDADEEPERRRHHEDARWGVHRQGDAGGPLREGAERRGDRAGDEHPSERAEHSPDQPQHPRLDERAADHDPAAPAQGAHDGELSTAFLHRERHRVVDEHGPDREAEHGNQAEQRHKRDQQDADDRRRVLDAEHSVDGADRNLESVAEVIDVDAWRRLYVDHVDEAGPSEQRLRSSDRHDDRVAVVDRGRARQARRAPSREMRPTSVRSSEPGPNDSARDADTNGGPSPPATAASASSVHPKLPTMASMRQSIPKVSTAVSWFCASSTSVTAWIIGMAAATPSVAATRSVTRSSSPPRVVAPMTRQLGRPGQPAALLAHGRVDALDENHERDRERHAGRDAHRRR